MNIGERRRTIYVEPIEEPATAPVEEPSPALDPTTNPSPETEPAPAR